MLAAAVSNLVLYNADTDRSITTLADGAVIDFAKIGTDNLSIVATTSSDTASVKFGYDSNGSYQIENIRPFAILGDKNGGGDLNPWTPSLGTHTVKVTPYSAKGASGTAGASKTISFSVVNGGGSTPSETGPSITGVKLYNADTGQSVTDLTDGATIDFAKIGTKNLSIVATGSSGTDSIRFTLDGSSQIENIAPYAIRGDKDGDYNPWTPSTGSHTLKLTAYTGDGASGTAGATRTINFTVTNGSTPTEPDTAGPSITSVKLYNADSDQVVMDLTDGATVDFSKIGTKNLSIVATGSSGTESIKFGYDSDGSYQVESAAPYAIRGDRDGDYLAWTPSTGSHTLKLTAYTGDGASGTAGATKTINFTVTSGTSSGGDDGGSTPDDSTGTDAPTAVITATSSKSIMAGNAVHFHALASTLRSGTPNTARYVWDFGDSGSDYNRLEGWNVAHVYEGPGTYTVKLTVTNGARKSHTVSTTVTVAANARKRIYVSAAGSDSNSGTSSSSPIRSIAKANTLIGDDTEILFRRGDTFTDSGSAMLVQEHNVVIGAYGSGDRPILKYTGDRGYSSLIATGKYSDTVTIRDLAFDTIYTEPDTGQTPQALNTGGTNVAVLDSVFHNVGYAINANGSPDGLLIQDNVAPRADGPMSYFIWMEGKDHVVVGNKVANSWGEHVLRVGGATRLNVAHNDFTNPPEPGRATKGTLTIHAGSYVYVANNTMTDGVVTIGPLDLAGHEADRWHWAVFENNLINSPLLVEHGTEHIMVRNNVLRVDGKAGIQLDGYSSSFGRGISDLQIYNNTGINNGTYGSFLSVRSGASGISLVNNLFVAPNLQVGKTGAAPVFVEDDGLSTFKTITNNVWEKPSIDGYADGGINYVWPYWSDSRGYQTPAEWNAFAQVGTDVFSDTPIGSGFAPSGSSTAADAGKVIAGVFTDRTGKLRASTGSWSAGAVEV